MLSSLQGLHPAIAGGVELGLDTRLSDLPPAAFYLESRKELLKSQEYAEGEQGKIFMDWKNKKLKFSQTFQSHHKADITF